MAKRQLRESLKSEIDNLFRSPETAESEFQQATKKRRLDNNRISSTPSKEETFEQDPSKPKLELKLSRLGDGYRLDCETLSSFIHYSIFGSTLQKPRWISLSHHRNVLQTLVIRVNVEEDFFITTNLSFPNEFFDRRWIELDSDISDRSLFWNSIMNVRLTIQEQIRRKSVQMQKSFDKVGSFDRSHFVLSTSQLAEKNFPLPGEEGIVPTKQRYKKLSSSSPLFSVDCEMCETDLANRALTRISIVDEQENTILDTLVKPDGEITDYVTRYSGITADMMEGVTTTLEDVQKAVQNLLPPDAILVGHSLEHDLHAMKMSHPFCLDVGHVLNYTNSNTIRNSLKNLTELFLGVNIQSEFGHCSYEDAWAAMRLAQLKIEKGIMFGNTSYGWKYSEYAKQNGIVEKKSVEAEIVSIPCSSCCEPTVVGCTVVNCRCRVVSGPSKCIHCVKMGDSEQGDFDWQDTLQVETDKTTSPIESYLKKDKMKSVMCAFETAVLKNSPSKSKKIRTKLPSSFPSCESFVNNVAAEMLNDSAIFVEIDKGKIVATVSTDNEGGEAEDNAEALNRILEKLVASTTKNSMIMMIFSNSNKNTLYVRVK
uniref:Exonuclease domain-containing protein n=1 Tax=Caenorhabditis tropicalis TaxID=1561998 RepID=A0A1I7U6P4_9PELO